LGAELGSLHWLCQEASQNPMITTSANLPSATQPKEHRDQRLRNQHFPNAEKVIFDKTKNGFVPMPILMRKAMKYLSPPEVRVLVYLQTRCSRFMICFPTLEEIAHDLGLAGRRNLTPLIKSLEKKKFISTATGEGKKFFLVHDPTVAIIHLVEDGTINQDQLYEINVLLGDLNREKIVAVKKDGTTKITPIARAKGA
jgi:DNA-binding MarR family transcriptional regulator